MGYFQGISMEFNGTFIMFIPQWYNFYTVIFISFIASPNFFYFFSPLLFAAHQCSWVKVAAGWGPNSTENTENYETNIVTGTAFLSEAGLVTPIRDSWIAGTSCRPIFALASKARSEHTGSQPFSLSSALLHLKETPLPGELGGNRRKVTASRWSWQWSILFVDHGWQWLVSYWTSSFLPDFPQHQSISILHQKPPGQPGAILKERWPHEGLG
jgi:hypothetical protein